MTSIPESNIKRLPLTKSQILRGFKSFESALNEGRKFNTENLFASVLTNQNEAGLNIKVGFLISKKKFEKLIIATA